MKLFFKYNVDSRGREGSSNTWIIYQDVDTAGLSKPLLTDHIELSVPITTQEKQLGYGFGMTCEGVIEHDMDLNGLPYIKIVKET